MKKLFIIAISAFTFFACADSSENRTDSDVRDHNESEVQPPSDAVPDSMQIQNDSVIVPENATDSAR